MRFEQFENDALINYGKKHGYITEGMSDEEINEILPAVAAAARMGAKGVGMAAKGAGKLAKAGGKLAYKGAKAAAPHVKKAAVATGKAAGQQIAKGAKAAGQQVAKGAKAVGKAVDQAGGVGGIAQKTGAAVGRGVDKVKAVGQQAAQGFQQQQAQAGKLQILNAHQNFLKWKASAMVHALEKRYPQYFS